LNGFYSTSFLTQLAATNLPPFSAFDVPCFVYFPSGTLDTLGTGSWSILVIPAKDHFTILSF
jgi:hypothetical protein